MIHENETNRPMNRRRLLAGAAGLTSLAAASRFGSVAAQSPEASPVEGDVRIVSAANGDIEIVGTPNRIVVLEYELAEDAAILGLNVVGLAERDSVNQWVPLPTPYSDEVTDVGSRDEVDIEAIIALDPDLILAAKPRQDAILAQLEAIAPTVQLETYSPIATPVGMTPIEHSQSVLTSVAQATGTETIAEAAIAEFDALLESGAAAIAATDYAGAPFVWLGNITTDGVSMFNDHARIGYTVSQLGLVNQTGENEETPGLHYVETSMEQLGTLPPETLVFTSTSPAVAAEREEIYASDLWQGLPWVQAGNFHDLGEPNVWAAGSTITLSNLVERVVAELGGTIEPAA